MQLLHLVPQGTFEVGETLKEAAKALVAGGQQKVSRTFLSSESILTTLNQLFTPMALFVARKPKAIQQ